MRSEKNHRLHPYKKTKNIFIIISLYPYKYIKGFSVLFEFIGIKTTELIFYVFLTKWFELSEEAIGIL